MVELIKKNKKWREKKNLKWCIIKVFMNILNNQTIEWLLRYEGKKIFISRNVLMKPKKQFSRIIENSFPSCGNRKWTWHFSFLFIFRRSSILKMQESIMQMWLQNRTSKSPLDTLKKSDFWKTNKTKKNRFWK